MVVADSDGDLSTQAIPSGGGSMPNGSNNGDMMYWDGTAWQTIAVGSAGAVLQIIGELIFTRYYWPNYHFKRKCKYECCT